MTHVPASAAHRYYRIAGLQIASEIDLPGAIELTTAPTAVDVRVRRVSAIAVPEETTVIGPNWTIAGSSFHLHIPSVARYHIAEGTEIAMATEPGVADADAVIFLLGTAFAILLYQRREIVMHASAVMVGGRAILFAGRSGAGKSTLAAVLGQRGFAQVNDDLCRVGFDAAGRPVAYPDGRKAKLWRDTLDQLAIGARAGARVRAHIDKYYVDPPVPAREEPVPIAAIYALREQRPPFAFGIERPSGLDAAQLLGRGLYRGRVVPKMGLSAEIFAALNRLRGAAAIFRLTRPSDFALMDDVAGLLEAHWAGLGLLEEAA
jgi:hypothetical protein